MRGLTGLYESRLGSGLFKYVTSCFESFGKYTDCKLLALCGAGVGIGATDPA